MTDHEAQAAWRLLTLNWIPLALMALTLALCLAFTRFSMKPEGALLSLGAIALYAGLAYYNALTPHRREPLVIFTLGSTAQLSNGAMMLATPIGGAHYFVDVFAGVAVAVLAIVAARWIGARVMKRASQPVAAATMPAGAVSTQ